MELVTVDVRINLAQRTNSICTDTDAFCTIDPKLSLDDIARRIEDALATPTSIGEVQSIFYGMPTDPDQDSPFKVETVPPLTEDERWELNRPEVLPSAFSPVERYVGSGRYRA